MKKQKNKLIEKTVRTGIVIEFISTPEPKRNKWEAKENSFYILSSVTSTKAFNWKHRKFSGALKKYILFNLSIKKLISLMESMLRFLSGLNDIDNSIPRNGQCKI